MQIYYFTRTERSKRIAEELAAHHSVQAQGINDGKSWDGTLGYLRAGFLSATKKSLPTTYHKPADDEPIVLVFPVWAGTFPPAVRTFTAEVGRERITAVPTSLGSTIKDRQGFAKVIDLVGSSISAPEELL